MRHITPTHVKSIIGITLVMGAGFACQNTPEEKESNPPQNAQDAGTAEVFEGTAELTGKVDLPRVHTKNIMNQFAKPTNLHTMPCHMEAMAAFEAEPTINGVYPLSQFSLQHIGRVIAVAIPPPDDDDAKYPYPANDEINIDIDDGVYAGTINKEGIFSIKVPAYPFGYVVSGNFGKIRLKTRYPLPVKKDQQVKFLNLNVEETLVANVAQTMAHQGRTLDNLIIKEALGDDLTNATAELVDKLKGDLRIRDWWLVAKNLFLNSSLAQDATFASTFYDSSHTDYNDADLPFYNLMNAEEITDNLAGPRVRTLNFIANSGARLRNQYVNSHGVLFIPYNAASGDDLTGATRGGTITENTGGFAVVSVAEGGGIDLMFRTPGRRIFRTHSVGFTIQNGSSHADTTSDRRPFRVFAYDRGGNLLTKYHWYTSQETEGPGFYGLTSPEAIFRLRIIMVGAGDYTLSNLVLGSDYIELENLGWRSTGRWTKTTASAEIPEFTYTDRKLTDPIVEAPEPGESGPSCNYSKNYSGGTYWTVDYGTHLDEDGNVLSEGSSLISPAYTLTNMIMGPEDAFTWNYLISGTREDLTTETTLGGGPACSRKGTWANSIARINGGNNWPTSDIEFTDGTETITQTPIIATMKFHWSHVHWQARADIDEASMFTDTATTTRIVEYSTDNGKTWATAFWYEDENHKGRNGVWWNNHMHPFPDSDLQAYKEDFSDHDGGTVYTSTCTNTDFDKDGTADYNFDVDGDGTGAVDGDTDDCRQWDTEFYMDVPADRMDDVDGDGIPDSLIEGTSMLYRFRFNSSGTPTVAADGCADSCSGWSIDDVALNNDDPDVGYYTNFDSFTIP